MVLNISMNVGCLKDLEEELHCIYCCTFYYLSNNEFIECRFSFYYYDIHSLSLSLIFCCKFYKLFFNPITTDVFQGQ